MVDDDNIVCCMCGDVGFSDKLFRCLRCASRFQHTYCGSYYEEISTSSKPSGICDWCRSSEPTSKSIFQCAKDNNKSEFRSSYDASGERIKQRKTTRIRMMSSGATPSHSPTSKSGNGRRYKLLKDVLC